MTRPSRVALVAVVALALTACQPNRILSGWVPYWGGPGARQAIADPSASMLIDDVSFMWYGTAADGSVPPLSSTTNLAAAVAAARSTGLPVLPTIFDSSATGVMRAVLHDPTLRTKHVTNIVNLVTSKGYDGIDLDYEVFAWGDGVNAWAAIQPDWTSFVQQLANALHAKGKLLSVTVPPVWNGGNSGYWVYDQPGIAPFVDRLRLMVYDWSVGRSGPIAPVSWVQSVLAYSSGVLDAVGTGARSKLQLGVPGYGREWWSQKSSAEVCPDTVSAGHTSIEMSAVAALATAHKVTAVRDTASGELTFAWDEKVTGPRISPPTPTPPSASTPSLPAPGATTGLQPALRLGSPVPVTCTVHHVVFSPDVASIRHEVDLAVGAHWSGVALWAFGYETSALYRSLAGVAAQRPTGTPSVHVDSVTATTALLRITGFAYQPEYDLPVPVTVTYTDTAANTVRHTVVTLARLARTDVFTGAAAGTLTGVGPFHGFDIGVPNLAPATYHVCVNLGGWGGGSLASTCVDAAVPSSIS